MSIFRGTRSRLSFAFRRPPAGRCRFKFPLAAVALLLMPAVAANAAADGVLELDEAVALALEHNPQLAGLRAQVEAVGTTPSQMHALPDPMLSLNFMNLPTDGFAFDQEPMTQVQLAVTQQIPFPGKRDLQHRAALHQVDATEAMLGDRESWLAGQVRIAWWRLMNLDRSLQIVAQNKELMRDFVEIAQTKYKVGSGLQQDVLLAQLELSRLLDREIRLRGMRRAAEAEINALLDRPADRAVMLPEGPANRELPDIPGREALLQQAADSRQLIAVQRELVDAARTRLELARRDRYPDLRVGVGYGFRQDDPVTNMDRSDFLSVMFTVTVPIFAGDKQNKAVEQRTHEVTQQNFALSDTLRRVESEVARSIAEYDAARDQVSLLETAIIPQAQQTVASMLAGYQVNQVDFLNLLNTQLTLYNAQINYWDSLSNAKQALARLAVATGTENLYE
ncbi:MAG: TolC family protein [Gammaproteobacteria bacterium]|nr:TolC family protein [Gammaproteobacteria bacterium]MDH4255134.1 TolC family protein [Gammaproteobacteria bacterium]MDH5309832.1 TolC family protein [Gammaproteobacteria bacterium]